MSNQGRHRWVLQVSCWRQLDQTVLKIENREKPRKTAMAIFDEKGQTLDVHFYLKNVSYGESNGTIEFAETQRIQLAYIWDNFTVFMGWNVAVVQKVAFWAFLVILAKTGVRKMRLSLDPLTLGSWKLVGDPTETWEIECRFPFFASCPRKKVDFFGSVPDFSKFLKFQKNVRSRSASMSTTSVLLTPTRSDCVKK